MRYIKSSDCCLFSCSVEQELQPKFVISCRCLVDLSRSPKDVITVFLPHPQVHEYLRSKLCSLYENDCIFDKFECVWNSSDRWAALGKQDLLHCEYSWKQSVWLSLSDATSCASVMPYLCQCLMFKSIPETSFVDLSSFFFSSVSLFFPLPYSAIRLTTLFFWPPSVIMTGAYNSFFRMFDRETGRGVTLEAWRESSKPRAVLRTRRVYTGGKRRRGDVGVDSLDFTKKILHMAWHPSENIIAIAATNNLYIFQDRVNPDTQTQWQEREGRRWQMKVFSCLSKK